MDGQKAKKIYEDLKQDAAYNDFGIIFNDKKQQLFIKKWPWKNCEVHHYSDIVTAMFNEGNTSVDKGHPYAGAVVGNLLTGSFAGGLAGAMIGQQTSGKKVRYYNRPSVNFLFYDGTECVQYLLKSHLRANSFSGRTFFQRMSALEEKVEEVTNP